MRAAIYKRVGNTGGHAEPGQQQEDICRQHAQENGWTVTRVYADLNVGRGPAVALEQMLSEVDEFDCVIISDKDRLTRDAREVLRVLDALDDADVEVHVPGTGKLTPVDRVMLRILTLGADAERQQASERAKAAWRRRRAQQS